MELDKKTVIVTGGGSGLGFEMVRTYLLAGYNVVMCGRRLKVLKNAIKTLQAFSGIQSSNILAVKTDMSRESDIVDLIYSSKEKFKSIDVFINNAGTWSETPILKSTSDEIDSLFNNILKTTILGTKIAGTEINSGGSIINLGSFAGLMALKSASLYSTFKAAIHHFTKSAAFELAEKNIRVNCVIPGVIKTPMTEDYIKNNSVRLLKPISLKRFGSQKEIADGVFFLSSEKASYITGICLEITGGKYLTQL